MKHWNQLWSEGVHRKVVENPEDMRCKHLLTGADKSLSVDTQGYIRDKDRASNCSKTRAPAVIGQQSASIL